MRNYVTNEINVSDRGAQVCGIPQDIDKVLIKNVGEQVVFVGGESVSPRNGFPVDPGQRLEVPCFESDVAVLYAISANGQKSRLRFFLCS